MPNLSVISVQGADAAGLVNEDLAANAEGQCVLAAGGPSTKDSVKGYGNAGISNGGAGAILNQAALSCVPSDHHQKIAMLADKRLQTHRLRDVAPVRAIMVILEAAVEHTNQPAQLNVISAA